MLLFSSFNYISEFNLVEKKIKREKINHEVFNLINDTILDADLDSLKKSIIAINNDCGTDGCQSNLQVNASMPPEIIVGKNDFSTVDKS